MSKILNVSANIQNWSEIYDFIVKYFLEQKIPKKDTLGMLVSAEEIFTNIINHAQVGKNSKVKIHVNYVCLSGNMSLIFEYSGIEFDPSGVRIPNIKKLPKERKAGGLGLLIVNKFTDSITYRRLCGKNILEITKKTVNF